MPITISSDQKKFFIKNGFIEFDTLLSKEETKKILSECKRILEESPGHEEKNLHRSLPFLFPLFKKREIGKIAYLLIEKKPLRLDYDQFFEAPPSSFSLEEDQEIGLLLFLGDESKGLFFRTFPSYPLEEGPYFLLIFSGNPLGNAFQPILFP